MGNHHSGAYSGSKPRKNVHWKSAERPSSPGKPEIIPIASEDEPNAITLKWSPPKHDGGAPLQGFQVECNRVGSAAWIHTQPTTIGKPELILTGLEAGYRYQFRVSAVNGMGASAPSELSDILTVASERPALAAPKFLGPLGDVTALENETSEFRVAFDGAPPPTVAWFKDGFEIFSSRRTVITTDDTSSVLVFHQTLLSDEGEIKCTATNRAGHAVVRARLALEAAPKLRYPRQYEDGLLYEINETIFLKTSVVGKPSPEVEWRHDGRPLADDPRIEISNTPKFSMLRIHSARRSDRGEYQIRARNKLGEDAAAFLVTITAPPDSPRRVTVTRQVDKSVTLTWEPPEDDGGCRVGNYVVEYYRSGWNVWLKATTSRKLGATLFDLIEGSEYRFRVKAESPYGMSEPSERSAAVLIPGKSADMDFLAVESRIISEALEREDGEPAQPLVSPRRRKQHTAHTAAAAAAAPPAPPRPQHAPARIDSTEFMLVLCPDGDKSPAEKRKSFQLDLEDSLSPPPISFSAPELGSRCIPFSPIRNSVSSTELLHERAMDRFYRAVAMKEELKAKKEEISNHAAKGNAPPKQPAIKIHQPDDSQTPLQALIKHETSKWDSVKSEQYSQNSPVGSQTLEVKQVSRWQSTSFDDDYTASTVSIDSNGQRSDMGSLDAEMDRGGEAFTDEEYTYNPRDKPVRSTPQKDDKAIEILNKPAPLPDPNFIPKPILKRRENEQVHEPEKKPEKMTIFKKITKMPVPKSFPFAKKDYKKDSEKLNEKLNSIDSNVINAAPNKDKLNANDDKELDEGRIVIEYYGNIVKEFGAHKKPSTPLYLNTEDLKKVAQEQQNNENFSTKPKQLKAKKVNPAKSSAALKSKLSNCAPKKAANVQRASRASGVAKQDTTSSPSKQEASSVEKRTSARATIVMPIDFERLEQQAKQNVRSVVDYTVDLCLLLSAFWFYFFKDERLAIPFLVLIIYRQVQEVVCRNIPLWVKRHTPSWIKYKNS